MLSPRWRKVLHDLWDNRSRTIMVVLAIAIGMTAFSSLLAARTNLLANIAESYTAANPADVTVQTMPFDDDLLNWARQQPYVTAAEGAAPREGRVLLANGTRIDISLIAYADGSTPQINRLMPETGSTTSADGEIVLERGINPANPIVIGDVLTLEANDQAGELTVVGTVYDAGVQAGLITSRLTGYVTHNTLADLGFRAGFSQLLLTLDRERIAADGLTLQQVADELRDGVQAEGVRTFGLVINEDDAHWASTTVGGIVLILVMVGMMSLVFSSFLIVTIISGFLTAQRRQIGIMKIVGGTRGAIIRIYLVMVTIFGLLGLCIALPLSSIIANAFVGLISATLNIDMPNTGLPPSIIAMQIAISLLVPAAAAFVPVFNATAVSPARAIREDTVLKAGGLERLLARLTVLPRPYLLALRGVFRNRGRLVLTLITLTLAGALFIGIWNVRATVPLSIENSLRMSGFDALVVFARPYDRDEMVTLAQEVEGITRAEGWLTTSGPVIQANGVQGTQVFLNGLTHDSPFVDPRSVEGRWLAAPTPATLNDVVITDDLATRETLNVGDTLTLLLAEEEVVFTVVGIVDSLQSAAYTSYDAVAAALNAAGQANTLQTHTVDQTGEGERAAADALRVRFEDENWFVLATRSQTDFISTAANGFNIVVIMLLSVAMMVLLVGGLGLAGTMSLSVMERIREIGVMRSVGAGTGMLARMFVLEGVFIGLFSGVLALVISVPFTQAFGVALGAALTGRPFNTVFTPTGPLLWIGIVAVVAALASLLPALRGSRISIREALAYE